MSHTVLRFWTEVHAWIYFFSGQTGVSIPDGIGQRTVFLEQFWRLEGERLLKARPHTNVRYSNEQSGPTEYYSSLQNRHPATCDIVQVYQFFLRMFSRFQFDKGVSDENYIWNGSVWCEWRAPLPPVLRSLNSSWCVSQRRRQRHVIEGSCPAGKNHTLSLILTDVGIVWIHLSNEKVNPGSRNPALHFKMWLRLFEIFVHALWVTWVGASYKKKKKIVHTQYISYIKTLSSHLSLSFHEIKILFRGCN